MRRIYHLFKKKFDWEVFTHLPHSRDIVSSDLIFIPVFIGLVSLFNGIATLCRLFNAKAILLEEQ